MGGIAAIFNFDGKPIEHREIAAMTKAMDYRGIDGISNQIDGPCAFGACESHTTTHSNEASQPWSNEDSSLILLLDGYAANHAELRRDLIQRGVRLRNRSDAELVLRAYETWGEQCPSRIEGEFAFVIWDAANQSAFCARDHQGLRPLFYHRSRTRLVLASDFAAFHTALAQPPEPNDDVLIQLCANHCVFREDTVWQGIKRVRPAHFVKFYREGARGERYWYLPEPYSIRYSTDEEYLEHYRHVLTESVRQSSRTQSTAGYEVSGGLDSSAVFAIADLLHKREDLPAPMIAGYTLAGPRNSEADETQYSSAVGEFLRRPIHSSKLHIPDFEWFQQVAKCNMDIPYYPNSAMMLNMYQAMARDGCRVAINGLGGDEWLNGSVGLFHQSIVARDWHLLGRSIRAVGTDWSTVQAARAFGRFGLRPIISKPVRKLAAHLNARLALREPPATPWLTAEARGRLEDVSAKYDQMMRSENGGDDRYYSLDFPMRTWILEHASRLRAQCGIEGRHPLASRAFIEFWAATPDAIRLRGRQTKFTHRAAMKSILPKEVTGRQSKAEFGSVVTAQRSAIATDLTDQMQEQVAFLIDKKGVDNLILLAQEKNNEASWKWPLFGIVATNQLYSTLVRNKGEPDNE